MDLFIFFIIIFVFIGIIFKSSFCIDKYERKKQIQKEANWEWFKNLSEYEHEVWTFGMFPFQKQLILDGIDDNPQIVMENAKKRYKIDEAHRNIWR